MHRNKIESIFNNCRLYISGVLFFFLLTTSPLIAQGPDSLVYPLYTSNIPNTKSLSSEVIEHRTKGGRFVEYISIPTITHFIPKQAKDKAIVICPGGGYRGLAIDKEGYRVARILQANGYHAFVLKYRCPEDSLHNDKSVVPLQDAQRAIQFVRELLKDSNLKVGIMGFSAGGHLAAMTSVIKDKKYQGHEAADSLKFRPDFSILIYPVISMEESLTHKGSQINLLGDNPSDKEIDYFSADQQLTEDCPPVFIIHASDDQSVSVMNSIHYYSNCIQLQIPAEMHLYKNGGHGFGLYNQATRDNWIERFFNWIETF